MDKAAIERLIRSHNLKSKELAKKAFDLTFEGEFKDAALLYGKAAEHAVSRADEAKYRKLQKRALKQHKQHMGESKTTDDFLESQDAQKSALKKAIASHKAKYGETFGLAGRKNLVFRISQNASFVDDNGQPVIYTQRKTASGWKDFAKGSPKELDRKTVRLAVAEADFKSRYGSARHDDMVLITQSGRLLPMQYVAGDSNYVYTKTKHKRYKRLAHAKNVSPKAALQKFNDWLKLDDD